MLRFIDSFNHYVTADITKKWTADSGNSIVASVGRRSGAALKTLNANTDLGVAAVASGIVGAAIQFIDSTALNKDFLKFRDGGTTHVFFTIDGSGHISVSRGDSTLLATSTLTVGTGAYHYMEFKVLISDTVGTVRVKVDGTDFINISGVDTKNSANATFDGLRLSGNATYFNDFYYCDTTGTTNNDFLGDCRVDAYLPSGNGNSSVLINDLGNSTNNYTHVDEAAPNSDTDYVQSATPGDKDTYNFADMSHSPASIFGVQVLLCAKKDDAGARSITTVTRRSSTDYDGATVALSTSYLYYPQIREVDPSTSAAWTQTNLNAAEFGAKIAA